MFIDKEIYAKKTFEWCYDITKQVSHSLSTKNNNFWFKLSYEKNSLISLFF